MLNVLKMNPYNQSLEDLRFCACVGNNSGFSVPHRDICIIDGYKESVDIIYNNIENEKATIDIIVYPFIFNCRHSIELLLKVLLMQIFNLYKIKNNNKQCNKIYNEFYTSLNQHNIEKIFTIINKYKSIDNEFTKNIDQLSYLEDCLKDYYFDNNADAFRYTYKKTYTKINLDNIERIDIKILYEKYNYIFYNIKKLILFCTQWFNEQYYIKTCTAKLNRSQIEDISKKLPDISKWNLNEFNTCRKDLCEEYQISSTELSNTINIIKNHYKFCTNIGLENKFKFLTEEIFKQIGEFIQENRTFENLKPKSNSLEDLVEVGKLSFFKSDYIDKGILLFSQFNTKDIYTLLTFCEFSSCFIDGKYYCEELDSIYDYWEKNQLDIRYVVTKILNSIVTNKYKKALNDCGQLTYCKWFDKYIYKNIKD